MICGWTQYDRPHCADDTAKPLLRNHPKKIATHLRKNRPQNASLELTLISVGVVARSLRRCSR